MKGKAIRKSVYKMKTKRNFSIQTVKDWINFVQIIVGIHNVRNRPATEPVTLKVHNIKLSFDIWLVLYMYFILYS